MAPRYWHPRLQGSPEKNTHTFVTPARVYCQRLFYNRLRHKIHEPGMAREDSDGWCERGDSNPHPLRDQILNLARLPIPPLSRGPN